MGNLAYQMDFQEIRKSESIDGVIYNLASASRNHNRVVDNIKMIFDNYLRSHKCQAHRELNVFFNNKDHVIPDVIVVCNQDIDKPDGVHGAPDLIVEVLSPSTEIRDRRHKMKLYERNGVKEYWLVNTLSLSIEVYLLTDNKFELSMVYRVFPDYEIGLMTDRDKEENLFYEFKTSIFSDLVINIKDVFDRLI